MSDLPRSPHPPIPAAVTNFIVAEFTRYSLSVPLHPLFYLDNLGLVTMDATTAARVDIQPTGDAQCHLAVHEIAVLQKTIFIRFGTDYTQFLQSQNVWPLVIHDAALHWHCGRNVRPESAWLELRERIVQPVGAQVGALPLDRLVQEYLHGLSSLDLKGFKNLLQSSVTAIRQQLAGKS